MYSGVRRAGGPPGLILRRLYSLQGGAHTMRPMAPLQHRRRRDSNAESMRMSWAGLVMMSRGS